MHGYVYVADFGDFRKVGMSGSPKMRVLELSQILGKHCLELFTEASKNKELLESKVLSELDNYKVAGQEIKRELFSCSMIDCKDALRKVKAELELDTKESDLDINYKVSKTFRLHPEVVAALKKKAIEEGRSEANVVERTLAEKFKVKVK